MRYIKTYETLNISDRVSDREKILTSVCLYFESIIPITKEEGFIECLFDDEKGLHKEYFSFYFKDFSEEEVYEKFEKFIKSLKLKIIGNREDVQIDIKVPEYKIKNYAYLYNMTKKYNI